MTIEEKADLYNKLEDLIGYWKDGSDSTITIYQDGCTQNFHLKINSKVDFWAKSLKDVILLSSKGKR